MNARIAVLPGDGIGPEVCAHALRVLGAVEERYGHAFERREFPIGGAAIDAGLGPLPAATRAACVEADAVLLGAVGGPRWSDPSAPERPEQGLLALRSALGVFANVRPVHARSDLGLASPLRREVLEGVDLVFVRELTGGIYFGEKRREGDRAVDVCAYTKGEVERVVRVAIELARGRRGHLTLVDKANVLETSRLWREVTVALMEREAPDVELRIELVDAMAMHLIRTPSEFDVVVTENLFGDVLTDEASVLAGSLGLQPSASLGSRSRGLYEPIHGSAPDLAGLDVANPIGTILSVALMLRHSFGLEVEARAVESAVERVLARGVRTRDIAEDPTTAVPESVLAEEVVAELGG